MIHYRSDGIRFFTKLCQLNGSVFPVALTSAAPCAVLAALSRYFANEGYLGEWWISLIDHPESILKDNAMWSGFTFLVGFLVVFRTSQSYSRYWEGCATPCRMRAVWFSACSALCAFTRSSKQDATRIVEFKELLVRLFSILHALALAEIEECNIQENEDVPALNYPVIDPMALDDDVLAKIRDSPTKPELVFQWIQQYIVEQIASGVLNIAPPILSRSFQDLAGGMMIMYEAMRISSNPFPFPYAQTCDCLLIIHWLVTPLVSSARGDNPVMVFLFSFITVFIMWTLNLIAVELENPFGSDANDLDCAEAQQDFNQSLAMLLQPVANRLPKIPSKEKSHPDERCSLAEAWLILKEIEVWHGASMDGANEMGPANSTNAKAEAEKSSVEIARSGRNRKGRQALTLTNDKQGETQKRARSQAKISQIVVERMSQVPPVKADDGNAAKVILEKGENRSTQLEKGENRSTQLISTQDVDKRTVVSSIETNRNSDEGLTAAEPTREVTVPKFLSPSDKQVSSEGIKGELKDDLTNSLKSDPWLPSNFIVPRDGPPPRRPPPRAGAPKIFDFLATEVLAVQQEQLTESIDTLSRSIENLAKQQEDLGRMLHRSTKNEQG